MEKHTDNRQDHVTDRFGIIRKLEKNLKYKRFIHTLGVSSTAACLAMRWGADMDKAETAGLLHDCAKSMELDDMRRLCKEAGLEISAYENKSSALLHAKAGSILARTEYGCTDEEILMAIRSHTTGRPGMSLLEKIIFVADYIEPGRTEAPALAPIRTLSFENLDAAVVRILHDTLAYLEEKGSDIDPATLRTYTFYDSGFTRSTNQKG